MVESREDKIERFREFYQQRVASAMSDCNLEHDGLHAKILLCAIIDSLSLILYPRLREKNRQRFVETLSACGGWPEGERVSLMHLRHALETNKSSEFSRLRSWVMESFDRKFSFRETQLAFGIPISEDPTEEEVKRYWPIDRQGCPMTINNKGLDCFRHKRLLWMYRNKIIHDYRIPADASEFSPIEFPLVYDKFPYYQQGSELRGDLDRGLEIVPCRWTLVYPTEFFRCLAEDILDAVVKHYLKNEWASPFAYNEGKDWMYEMTDG
jgi:hypothetical protein